MKVVCDVKLRKLEIKDAPLMLEWMHDDSVVKNLKINFAEKTIADCEVFIIGSQEMTNHLHLAIVDENDEYMGTVSLKHIENAAAEFGIAVRRCAMGKGYSYYGMTEIIKYGKKNLNLNKIYWCVDPENGRAVRFYDKHGYSRINVPKEAQGYSDKEKERFIWYEA